MCGKVSDKDKPKFNSISKPSITVKEPLFFRGQRIPKGSFSVREPGNSTLQVQNRERWLNIDQASGLKPIRSSTKKEPEPNPSKDTKRMNIMTFVHKAPWSGPDKNPLFEMKSKGAYKKPLLPIPQTVCTKREPAVQSKSKSIDLILKNNYVKAKSAKIPPSSRFINSSQAVNQFNLPLLTSLNGEHLNSRIIPSYSYDASVDGKSFKDSYKFEIESSFGWFVQDNNSLYSNHLIPILPRFLPPSAPSNL